MHPVAKFIERKRRFCGNCWIVEVTEIESVVAVVRLDQSSCPQTEWAIAIGIDSQSHLNTI